MIKRILIYVVVSSIISAGLLYLGITIMGKYSPDLASSLSALVAGTHGQNSSVALAADSDQSLKAKASVNSITTGLPVAGVTIAQLLNNPDHFIDQVITITGIATSLSDDKFLLNDGTGQILVEVEDDLVSAAALNSLSITVSGRLDGLGSQTGLELDASTLIDPNGAVIIDDVDDDDIDDDDDDIDDDDDDDIDDDDDDINDDDEDDDDDDDIDDDDDDDIDDDDEDDDDD